MTELDTGIYQNHEFSVFYIRPDIQRPSTRFAETVNIVKALPDQSKTLVQGALVDPDFQSTLTPLRRKGSPLRPDDEFVYEIDRSHVKGNFFEQCGHNFYKSCNWDDKKVTSPLLTRQIYDHPIRVQFIDNTPYYTHTSMDMIEFEDGHD